VRKIAATYVFPLRGAPIKNAILVCNADGTIVDLIDRGNAFREEAGVEFYSGILVPGFICAIDNLQNHTRVTNRKLWAAGIALVADIENNTYVECEKNACTVQKLASFSEKAFEPNCLDFCHTIDSSAILQSNSLLNEIFHLQEKNNSLNLSELLKQVSLYSAELFGFDSKFGSFAPNKQPGVNLISGIDFKQLKLKANSKVKRLI